MKVLFVYSVAIWCLYGEWIQANVLNPDQQLDVLKLLKKQQEQISKLEDKLKDLSNRLANTVSMTTLNLNQPVN